MAVQKLETARRSKVPEEGTEHAQPRAVRAAQRLVLMKESSEYDSTECDDEFVKKHGGKAHGVCEARDQKQKSFLLQDVMQKHLLQLLGTKLQFW